MISIIVPVYNVEKYIKECIDSIINQSYKDLEIILIDDGSTDNSGVICDEYAKKDARIKVIHKENGGQSSARNLGLELATGEYVGFVDSDDTIEKEMYEVLYSSILGKDIAICSHNVVYDEKVERHYLEENFLLDTEGLWQEIFGRLNNAVWNKLYRRDLLKGIFFDLNYAHGEDLLFNIQYLQSVKNGCLVNKALYNYYKRGDSITTGKFSRRKLLEIDSKDEALRLVKEIYPEMAKTAKKYCFRARMNIMRNIYKARLEKEYKQELKQYNQYVIKNYKEIKHNLKRKERIEFLLLKYCSCLYRCLARKYN